MEPNKARGEQTPPLAFFSGFEARRDYMAAKETAANLGKVTQLAAEKLDEAVRAEREADRVYRETIGHNEAQLSWLDEHDVACRKLVSENQAVRAQHIVAMAAAQRAANNYQRAYEKLTKAWQDRATKEEAYAYAKIRARQSFMQVAKLPAKYEDDITVRYKKDGTAQVLYGHRLAPEGFKHGYCLIGIDGYLLDHRLPGPPDHGYSMPGCCLSVRAKKYQ